MDHVEVFLLHAVPPKAYEHVTAEILPHLLRQKEAGKILHIGVTETAPNDPKQEMIRRAVRDDPWEVVMLAFHMMNQKARRHVFPETRRRGRSEEHTSELQSLMRISYAVFCLNKKKKRHSTKYNIQRTDKNVIMFKYT